MSRIVSEMRQWRRSRGLKTYAEAGAVLGVDKAMWHAWENGRRIPKPDYIRALYRVSDGAIRADHFYHLPTSGVAAVAKENRALEPV